MRMIVIPNQKVLINKKEKNNKKLTKFLKMTINKKITLA